MDVNYIYQFSLRLMLKNQAGGLSPSDFGYHWNGAQSSYQSDLLGRFQRGANGKSGNNTGLIENETILTKLMPFISTVNITAVSGQAPKPDKFVYTLALRSNNYVVFSVTHDKIWSLYQDVIDPPSITDNTFYYTEYQAYYSLIPAATPTIDLDFVASPTDVKWGFNLDANNRAVYSVGDSVQPQWDDNSCREITERMMKTIGVSFHDKDFEQFGQSVLNAGE